MIRWFRHVEEDRIDAGFVKAFHNVLEFELHPIGQPHPIEVLVRQVLHLRPDFVGDHAAARQRRLLRHQVEKIGAHRSLAGVERRGRLLLLLPQVYHCRR